MGLTNLLNPLLSNRSKGFATKGFATTVFLSVGIVFSTGCAGSSVGDSLQQSLEADPQLEQPGTLLDN